MNASKIIAAAALSLLAAAGAQAENYSGVQTVNSVVSRAEVAADARVAARSADIFGEASYGGVAPVLTSGTSRAAVHSAALQTAREGNIYGDAASYGLGTPSVGQADRAAVRAEARAAARNAAL